MTSSDVKITDNMVYGTKSKVHCMSLVVLADAEIITAKTISQLHSSLQLRLDRPLT